MYVSTDCGIPPTKRNCLKSFMTFRWSASPSGLHVSKHFFIRGIVTLSSSAQRNSSKSRGNSSRCSSSDGMMISCTFFLSLIREPVSRKSYLPSATKYLISCLARGYCCYHTCTKKQTPGLWQAFFICSLNKNNENSTE